jgi:hypothetical protein
MDEAWAWSPARQFAVKVLNVELGRARHGYGRIRAAHAVGSRAGAGDRDNRLAPASLRPGPWWLVLLGLFALVAASVELGWWDRLDHSVNDWAALPRKTLPWSAAKVVVDVATPEVALPVTLAIGLLAAWRWGRWGIAGEAAIRVGLVVASVLLLKPLLAVPGPTRNPLGTTAARSRPATRRPPWSAWRCCSPGSAGRGRDRPGRGQRRRRRRRGERR